MTVVSKKEWYSEIESTHKLNISFLQGYPNPDSVDEITFKNDIKWGMKDQLDKYRVVIPYHVTPSIDKSMRAYEFEADGSVRINFLEYNNGKGIDFNYKTSLKICTVLKDGTEINVYDHLKQEN